MSFGTQMREIKNKKVINIRNLRNPLKNLRVFQEILKLIIEIKVALKDVSIIFDFQQTFRTDRYKEVQKLHILENDVSQV